MKVVLDKVATMLAAAILAMVPWIALLGDKTTTALVVSSMCVLALAFTARGEIIRSPWFVLAGCLAGWFFIGGPSQMAPEGHVLREGLANGFTIRDAVKVQSIASLTTISFFLVYHMSQSRSVSQGSKKSPRDAGANTAEGMVWRSSED
jgi:hypothetical protein